MLLTVHDVKTGIKTEKAYDISVEDNRIVIDGADEYVTYWGDAEWNWN